MLQGLNAVATENVTVDNAFVKKGTIVLLWKISVIVKIILFVLLPLLGMNAAVVELAIVMQHVLVFQDGLEIIVILLNRVMECHATIAPSQLIQNIQ